jgi:hypothetical protein
MSEVLVNILFAVDGSTRWRSPLCLERPEAVTLDALMVPVVILLVLVIVLFATEEYLERFWRSDILRCSIYHSP